MKLFLVFVVTTWSLRRLDENATDNAENATVSSKKKKNRTSLEEKPRKTLLLGIPVIIVIGCCFVLTLLDLSPLDRGDRSPLDLDSFAEE